MHDAFVATMTMTCFACAAKSINGKTYVSETSWLKQQFNKYTCLQYCLLEKNALTFITTEQATHFSVGVWRLANKKLWINILMAFLWQNTNSSVLSKHSMKNFPTFICISISMEKFPFNWKKIEAVIINGVLFEWIVIILK